MMRTTNTMLRREPEIQMSPEAAAEVAARHRYADAYAFAEDWEVAMNGASASDPPEDPSQAATDPATAAAQSVDEWLAMAAEQAAASRTAALSGDLTHARVVELQDRVGAIRIDANAAKSAVFMRRLAGDHVDILNMAESYDVPKAKLRDEYGKVVERGIKFLKIADLYEKRFVASESPDALKALKESLSAFKVLAKEMKNQQVTATGHAQGAAPVDPTDAAVQARWNRLSEAQRETRERAAGLAMDGLDERIARAEKEQTQYRKSIKYLQEHFPGRGGYLKSVAPINAILSGKVAPRPDPALSPEAADDKHAGYVRSANEAQALADEAAAARDQLQPGSEAYCAALKEVKQLDLAVSKVDAAKPCAPPAGATNEEAAAAHAATRAWQVTKGEATMRADAARGAMYRRYLSNEARRVGADFDSCATKYTTAVAAWTHYGNQGEAGAVPASMAEHEARSMLSDQWAHANAKWRSCNSNVQLWTSMAEKLRPTPKPAPLSLRQQHTESVHRVLAPCPDESWMRVAPPKHSTTKWRALLGGRASVALTEAREPTSLDVGVAAFNRQREAKKANSEAALQLRAQLVDEAKCANRITAETKAAAERLRESNEQAKQDSYRANYGTLVGFEQMSRDIAGEFSKAALANFPKCCAGKRKNKMEATIEQPDGDDRMPVQGPSVAKRAKTW